MGGHTRKHGCGQENSVRLSEPKRPPGAVCARVREFCLRSFDLARRDGCWRERSSLQFSDEEAPLSPTAEGFIMGQNRDCAALTSFTVVASKRYIFVLHYAVPRVQYREYGWYAIISSTQASLYDTLTDTWRAFKLPDFLLPSTAPHNSITSSPSFPAMVYFNKGRKLTDVLCAATDDALLLITHRQDVWFHSLAEGELDQPWKLTTFVVEDRRSQPEEPLYYTAMSASLGIHNEFCISVVTHRGPQSSVSVRKVIRAKATPERLRKNARDRLLMVSTMTDEVDCVTPSGTRFDIKYHNYNVDIHSIDGEVLTLGKGAGGWQGSKMDVEYVKPFKGVFAEPVGEVLWSRFLPMLGQSPKALLFLNEGSVEIGF